MMKKISSNTQKEIFPIWKKSKYITACGNKYVNLFCLIKRKTICEIFRAGIFYSLIIWPIEKMPFKYNFYSSQLIYKKKFISKSIVWLNSAKYCRKCLNLCSYVLLATDVMFLSIVLLTEKILSKIRSKWSKIWDGFYLWMKTGVLIGSL